MPACRTTWRRSTASATPSEPRPPSSQSRPSVGARATIAMTLIAIAAVMVSVALASRSVDRSLDVFAAQRPQHVAVAGSPRLTEARISPELLHAEDAFIDQRLTGVRLLGVGLALVFALVSAGLITVTLVRPLRRLTAATEQMGGGDLDVRAEVGGGAEFEQLGSAFNRLAATLRRED